MSKAKPADLAAEDDEGLMSAMDDDSSWNRATAKSKIGKPVGGVVVKPGKGAAKSIAHFSEVPLSAKAVATAKLTRIAIIYNGPVNGRPEWELAEEVRHFDHELGATLIAPQGYKFDLASIPRPLWAIIAPFELSTLAPLFHDLIYEFKGNMPSEDYIQPHPFRRFGQKDADDLFLRLMVMEGIPWRKRNAAYVAVRAAGWAFWNS